MAMETTLILVKPDGVQRGLAGEIISRFERKGLIIAGMKLMNVTPELAEEHYGEHRERPFFGELTTFMSRGPIVVMALEAEDAITKYRTVIGDDVFVGSDTQLVAPVNVGDGATIGAGSTITRDVPPGELTLSRSKQQTREGWKRPVKKR